MAVRPMMTEAHLKNIRTQASVFHTQCGGKGTLTLEQLENHAIIAAWNAAVAADISEGTSFPDVSNNQPVLELKRSNYAK